MTTNHPKKLDDALIRDGWVDLKIEFGLLQKEELRDLFIQMYTHKDRTSSAHKASAVPSRDSTFSQNSSFDMAMGAIKHTGITPTTLHVMAEKFAALLPKKTLSAGIPRT